MLKPQHVPGGAPEMRIKQRMNKEIDKTQNNLES